MKSVFITFIMFACLFGILQFDIASLISNAFFPIVSLIIFLLVITIAVSLFGFPRKKDFLTALKFKKKEAENEKDK